MVHSNVIFCNTRIVPVEAMERLCDLALIIVNLLQFAGSTDEWNCLQNRDVGTIHSLLRMSE